MKISVERDALTDAVTWTARTLPSRATVQVLNGLLLEVGQESGGGLAISGFDFEVAAQAQVAVLVGEAGRVLVSGRLLAEICRSLPNAPVELVTDGSRLVVTCGTARFQLPTMPVEDYPTLPEVPPLAGRIPSVTFAAAVAQVAVAAGRDDTLPVLTGVRVEMSGGTLTLAATDRYRLAVRELAWAPEDPEGTAVALVRARTLADAAKALAGSGGEVTVALGTGAQGEGMAGFAAGDLVTTTRLLDGAFPQYRSLLPTSVDAMAELPSATLVEAVKRVSLVSSSRNAPVRMSFSGGGEDGEVLLEAGAGEDAQASERLPATYDGEPLTIGFNPAYLLDGLAQLAGDRARLSFTTPTRPALLTSVAAGREGDREAGPEDGYRYLMMPMRLPG